MKLTLIVTALALTSGCASLQDTVIDPSMTRIGYTSYDPCIRCGESWTQLPNPGAPTIRNTRTVVID